MTSFEARILVALGFRTADEVVAAMLAAGDHDGAPVGAACMCPECAAWFIRSHMFGRWNTCSDGCQARFNTAIFELDAGRSIVRIEDLTAERAAELLRASGLNVPDVGKVVLL